MFEKEIKTLLKKATNLKQIRLEIPPDPALGDYAFPCFVLSKKFKKSPQEIAQQLQKIIKPSPLIKQIQTNGPYLNFFINKTKLTEITLKKIFKEKNNYGSSNIGKGKKALIEHTSINPNASPHVGRARNALIGDSVTRLLKFQGYHTQTHYFINDVGKQIAILVLGCKKEPTFKTLLKIYIDTIQKIEKNPSLEKEALTLLNKLERGDKQIKQKFKRTVKICINGQTKILKELGITYDFFDYESKYLWTKKLQNILKKLEKTKKLFTDSYGRKILNQKEFHLPMKSPFLVLTRADGTSLYALRDIAYTLDKIKKTKDANIIILGEDQKLYFQQIKAALSLLGYKAPSVIHYSFVLLPEGKMSTRKGNLVLLEDFMKQAQIKAKKEIQKKAKTRPNQKLSKIIGYGAIKYNLLKISPEKNVLFNWESALSFEGDSAPYIQYAHARASSILRKAKTKPTVKINFSLLSKKEELSLIQLLLKFPQTISEATSNLKPNLIANYSYEVARSFNEFYHNCPIIKAQPELKKARLLLTVATKQVLRNSLNLLGIEAPERM